MSSRVICLDAGHGGSDPGAQSDKGDEKDYTILQTHVTSSIFHIHNIETILTRLKDRYISLSERVDIANSAGADAFLSFHYNAATSEGPSGTQILYWRTSGQAERLAGALLGEISPLDGEPDERWERIIGVPVPHFRNGMEPAVLKYTEMPAVIIETEFGTNPDDAEKLFDPAYMVAVAEATVRAVETAIYGD